ncbi:protein kinase [candidate division KSB1 bacterium]
MIGETISHYKILEKLGEGGMGVVYKAEDTKLKRMVALKFLTHPAVSTEAEKTRFVHEAQAAAALNHPNISTVFEIDEADDRTFIAMECIEGQSLREKIDSGQLKVDEALEIATQIAKGLLKAHEKGIIHRDIKPANIMITEDGTVKIMDFGLARIAGATKVTKNGSTLGTVYYMSPEQARGEETDHRSDIWSLGVVLYEMLTGQLPFKGEYESAVLYSITNIEQEPVTGIRSGIPLDLEKIVNKCLDKSADDRYPSVEGLLVDLRRLKKDTSKVSTTGSAESYASAETKEPSIPTVETQKTTAPPSGNRRITIFAAFVAAFAVIAILLFKLLLKPETQSSRANTLAVLPFENLSSSEDEYFTNSLTDEIRARLSNIETLDITCRNSSNYYKGQDITTKEIGEQLDVRYVLTGSVYRERPTDPESRIRVIPELIRTSDEKQEWSQIYEEYGEGIFSIQSDIAVKVAQALEVELLEPDILELEDIPTDNLEAYDYFLRGIDCYNRGFTDENIRSGVDLFQNAVNLDPNFAQAFARLSIDHSRMNWFSYDKNRERREKAKEAVDKAFNLKPLSYEVHLALGIYYYYCELDFDHALKYFNIARESQPKSAEIIAYIGYVQRRQGKLDQTITNLKKAIEFDPLYTNYYWNLGETYLLLKNYQEAERHLDHAINLRPNWPRSYAYKALIYLNREGDTEKAKAVLRDASDEIIPRDDHIFVFNWILADIFELNFQEALNRLESFSYEAFSTQFYYIPKFQLHAHLYGLMGDRQLEQTYYESSLTLIEPLILKNPEDERLHSALGIALAGLGRKDEAIREGEKGVELLPVEKEAIRGTYRIFDLAVIYTKTGEFEKAIDQLEYLMSIPSYFSIQHLKLDAAWDPLRSHPRFQKLLKGN